MSPLPALLGYVNAGVRRQSPTLVCGIRLEPPGGVTNRPNGASEAGLPVAGADGDGSKGTTRRSLSIQGGTIESPELDDDG